MRQKSKGLLTGQYSQTQQPQQNFQCCLNISSLVRIKLNTKKQPPSLLDSGDSYKEDLNIFPNFSKFSLNISARLVRIKLHSKNKLPSLLNC